MTIVTSTVFTLLLSPKLIEVTCETSSALSTVYVTDGYSALSSVDGRTTHVEPGTYGVTSSAEPGFVTTLLVGSSLGVSIRSCSAQIVVVVTPSEVTVVVTIAVVVVVVSTAVVVAADVVVVVVALVAVVAIDDGVEVAGVEAVVAAVVIDSVAVVVVAEAVVTAVVVAENVNQIIRSPLSYVETERMRLKRHVSTKPTQ